MCPQLICIIGFARHVVRLVQDPCQIAMTSLDFVLGANHLTSEGGGGLVDFEKKYPASA